MLQGYTEDDLVGLSEAEKAIMLAGDDDDADALEGDGDGHESDAGDAALAAESEVGKPAAEEAADEGIDTGVTFTAKTPEDAEAQRTALATRKDEAFQKLMDGEMEPADYRKVENEVAGELEKLMTATITDSVTGAITQANLQKAWQGELDVMVKTAKSEGLDYTTEALNKEFFSLVRVFGDEAGRNGMTDEGLKASKWALKQAHDTMKMRHAKPAAAPAPAPAKGREAPDLSGIPPSLSKAPVAAGANVADEFSHLEGLKGSSLEKAIAKLTPDQLERYSA